VGCGASDCGPSVGTHDCDAIELGEEPMAYTFTKSDADGEADA
jgi:hypothetical protein